MNNLVEIAFEKARCDASNSEYDRSVCTNAISVAYNTIENIEVRGEPSAYLGKIIAVIENLHADYNDPDGEYTNGTAIIGSLLGYIYEIKAL